MYNLGSLYTADKNLDFIKHEKDIFSKAQKFKTYSIYKTSTLFQTGLHIKE